MKNLFLILIAIYFSVFSYAIPQKIQGVDVRTMETISVETKSKKYFVLNFLNSKCPCSQGHFDHINSLQKEFKEFQFIGFNSNKNATLEKVNEHFNQYQINYPIIFDKSLNYANTFKALKTPHVFILNKAGEILYQGGVTETRNFKKAKNFYLKEALTQIQNNKLVTNKSTRTIGCYIQR